MAAAGSGRCSCGQLANLARLYWYTVEFGLLQTPEGVRIYGAGIVSSRAESIFALDDPSPNRLGFDLERVMRTPYRIDDFQQVYFVVPSLQALLDATLQDFAPIYERLARAQRHPDRGDRAQRSGLHPRHPGLRRVEPRSVVASASGSRGARRPGRRPG